MKAQHGIFTISLDFELYWGVRDNLSIDEYFENLSGERMAITNILNLFRRYQIHATWATVGFIFFNNREELLNKFPKSLPTYNNTNLSPYKYITKTPELDTIYHFAPDVIDVLKNEENQEIGSHTFSHYYCLEDGQSTEQFEQDLASAIAAAQNKNIQLKSFVFPRNQSGERYLPILSKYGIDCYRGNEKSWFYKTNCKSKQAIFARAFRLIDAYLPLSGHNTHDLEFCTSKHPYNFPSSRFLRPHTELLSAFDNLRLMRIKHAMTAAAKNNRLFHLWWHPHNFGAHLKENMNFLEKILLHFNHLKSDFGMKSMNMGELSKLRNHNSDT